MASEVPANLSGFDSSVLLAQSSHTPRIVKIPLMGEWPEEEDTRHLVEEDLVIPVVDYLRCFRVIAGVFKSEKPKNQPNPSLLYALAGARILASHYQLETSVAVGSALYRVHENKDKIMAFGHYRNEKLTASEEAFHAWIICDGVAIDFMGPIYREQWMRADRSYNPLRKGVYSIPRLMFQKRLSTMPNLLEDFNHGGVFYYDQDAELSEVVLSLATEDERLNTLIEVCNSWFLRPPTKIRRHLARKNEYGEFMKMKLSDIAVSGGW